LYKRIKATRVYATLIKSWLSFAVVMTLLVGLWAGTGVAFYIYYPQDFGVFFFCSVAAIGISAIGFIFNEPLVVMTTKAKRVKNREEAERMGVLDFYEDVHMLSKQAGLWKVPRIYGIPGLEVNACAFGWGLPGFSAVAATEGIIRKLDRIQLQGVLSHEIAHIKNKDIIIAVTLAALVIFFAFLAETLPRYLAFGGGSKSKSKSSKDALAELIAIVVVIVTSIIIGKLLGPILQMFISRQREYGADALGAKIMGSGKPLADALAIISDSDMPTKVGKVKASSSLFFLRASAKSENNDNLFSTHPSTDNRLKHLMKLEE